MIATMRDDPAVVELVIRARDGDQAAWDEIVDRYAPLLWSVCRAYRLSGPDADDAAAAVWLRLVESLGRLREPAALPGWLRSTARHECLYLLRRKQKQLPVADNESIVDDEEPASDTWLLAQERQIVLRAAFAGLGERCRRLLSMLFDDPPRSYAEISAELGMTIGGIGPTRQRCLDQLRRDPSVAALDDRG